MRKNRSDAVHIMMCCNALTMHNVAISLVTPTVKRESYEVEKSEIFKLYGLKKNFSIVELPTNIKEDKNANTNFWTVVYQKLLQYFIYYWRQRKNFSKADTIVYGQCFISVLPYILLKRLRIVSSKLVFTVAAVKQNSLLHKFVIRNADLIVAGLKYTVADIINYTGVKSDKFVDTPLVFLSNSMEGKEELNKEKCREDLKFNEDKKYIIYAGKTGINMKSVEYFIKCATQLSEYEFVIVGANETTMAHYLELKEKRNIKNLHIISFLPLPQYFKYVKAADLLVDYYESSYYNKFYLGPGKSSSYFNSKNPVLFSDLPSLRHLFPEDIVYFVEPDNPQLLAKEINAIFQDSKQMDDKAKKAYEYAQQHSFEYTMGKILDFCQSKLFDIG